MLTPWPGEMLPVAKKFWTWRCGYRRNANVKFGLVMLPVYVVLALRRAQDGGTAVPVHVAEQA